MIDMNIKELDALIERCMDKAAKLQRVAAMAKKQRKKLQRERNELERQPEQAN